MFEKEINPLDMGYISGRYVSRGCFLKGFYPQWDISGVDI